ncbi:MAG: autotransporter domain-containing protein, partial [Alphaproteobacteria bacterium]
ANLISTSGVITGDITGGSAVDTIRLNGGTITGNIDTAADADVLVLSGGTVTGNIQVGADNDDVTISGTTVTGTIGSSGGTDALTFSAGSTFTSSDTISGFNTIAANGTVNIRGNGITNDTTAMTIATTGIVNVSKTTNTLTTITNNGKLQLGGDVSFTATNFNTAAGSEIVFNVVSSTSASRIIETGAGISMAGSSATIVIGAGAGYIASGTSYLIADGASTSTLPSLTTLTSGLYSISITLVNSDNDVSLTIFRESTGSNVTSAAGKSIATTLDNLGASSTGDLLTIQSLLSTQTTDAGVDAVVESLTPAMDTGAAMAGANVGAAAGNTVSNRLASLRGSAIATGDGVGSDHMWLQAFGNMSEQDDKDGNKGYDSSTGGFAVGMDTDTVVEGMTTGLALSYAMTGVESNASHNAETDIDSYMLTGYGSKMLMDDIFVNGQVSVGYNSAESERQVSGFSAKTKGDFDGYQAGLKLEVGKDMAMEGMTITPLASAQYTYAGYDEYTETGPAALVVDADAISTLDLGLGGQVAWDIAMGENTLKPAVRAKYVYRAGDVRGETNSRFVAGGAAFDTQGIEADRSSFNLGAGVTFATVEGIDLSVDYDADIRDSLTGHTGQVKARWAF